MYGPVDLDAALRRANDIIDERRARIRELEAALAKATAERDEARGVWEHIRERSE
jgi:hypothetical protein